MGWQDRDYGSRQINYGGNPFSNPFLNIIFGSVPIGRWFGIRVRVHAMLIWFTVFQVFQAGTIGWQGVLASSVLLFAIVLLHEFGHCIGARLVGGHADNILLWPLGGLAFTDTRNTPWARFVTVACGPLVNVILASAIGAVLYFVFHVFPPLNPLFMWSPHVMKSYYENNPAIFEFYRTVPGAHWILWAYVINVMLLAFNLVPMYPMDGGKLFQIALWKPLGYFRSMNVACIVGMVGAFFLALWGLTQGTLFTVFIAVFGFMDCLNQRRILKYTAAEEASGGGEQYDLSAAWEHPDHPHRKKLKKRWIVKARRRAQAEQLEQAKIDNILAKVKDKGLHSLTWWEKRTLKRATERQRQRDLAERM